MSFDPPQPPDDAMGRRYSKFFKYAFVLTDAAVGLPDLIDENGNSLPQEAISVPGLSVTLLLPQQISLREPYATVVTVMQDGGKVIESRGQVLKIGSISGTTGFLPTQLAGPPPGRLTSLITDLDGQLGAVSGYMDFMHLRYLFRKYGDQRRRGNLDIQLHFFDYKNDDFWRIEPDSFDMARSSRKPMSYDYSVQFKCIEVSDSVPGDRVKDPALGKFPGFGGDSDNSLTLARQLNKISAAAKLESQQGVLAAVGRFADMVTSGINFLKYCDAVTQRAFQYTLNQLDSVVGFFENIHDFTQIEIVPTLLAQFNSSLAGLLRVVDKFASDPIAQELNAWWLEATQLSDHMSFQVRSIVASQPQRDVSDTDQRFSQGRMKLGATTDLMQEPSGGSGAPDANPFIGSSGLSLVTDVDALANASQYVTIVINVGEDIYALARRVFGRIERFVDLVLLNKLEFPFIVSDASNKPPGTLAWGDSIIIPARFVQSSTISDGIDASTVPTTAGTVTTPSLPSQLIDNTATWRTDQWVGYSITATTGGSTQTLICTSNTATQLTLNGNWTIAITPTVTKYTVAYVRFNPRRPVTPDARAYGADLLTVFGNDGRCDLSLGASSDLALAQGLDNFFQAIRLRARCPLGEHPFHKTYGMPAPVGRPVTDNVGVLYAFFMRRSLLSDPRVGRVSNIQLSVVGDTLSMSAEVQPVDSRVARPITTQVGA